MNPMELIANTIEERIQAAIKKGEFKNLPGEGKPLILDDNIFTPPEHRMAHRVLKNSGFVPPEVEMQNEVAGLRERLRAEELSDEDQMSLRKEIVIKEAAVAMALERLHRPSK